MATLTGACAAATLLNPYGWHLYQHLFTYLSSNWIREWIEEFQSPRFRSESMFWFEVLLALGIAALPCLLRRMRIRDAVLIAVWAHAALGSVRHVPCMRYSPPRLWRRNSMRFGSEPQAERAEAPCSRSCGISGRNGGPGQRDSVLQLSPS